MALLRNCWQFFLLQYIYLVLSILHFTIANLKRRPAITIGVLYNLLPISNASEHHTELIYLEQYHHSVLCLIRHGLFPIQDWLTFYSELIIISRPRRDSNPRPLWYQSNALPTELSWLDIINKGLYNQYFWIKLRQISHMLIHFLNVNFIYNEINNL